MFEIDKHTFDEAVQVYKLNHPKCKIKINVDRDGYISLSYYQNEYDYNFAEVSLFFDPDNCGLMYASGINVGGDQKLWDILFSIINIVAQKKKLSGILYNTSSDQTYLKGQLTKHGFKTIRNKFTNANSKREITFHLKRVKR